MTEPVKQEPVPEAPAAPEEAKPVELIVSEIPSFTEGFAAVEAVPAVRDISREIRRTRNKLEQLTKLRDAVRVISSHRNRAAADRRNNRWPERKPTKNAP